METIIIGDIHGSTIWKDIIDQEYGYHKVVFLGDYFDSPYYTVDEQIQNFRDIVDFYKSNKDKVVLLLGNHDYHYLSFIKDRCHGFSPITKLQVQDELTKLYTDGDIKIHYIDGKHLYSHAGYSKTFMGDKGIAIRDIKEYWYNSSDKSGYGNHKCQGPLWIRPDYLLSDMPDDYIQIVGHTEKKTPLITDRLILCDTLKHNKCVVHNGGFRSVTIHRSKYKYGSVFTEEYIERARKYPCCTESVVKRMIDRLLFSLKYDFDITYDLKECSWIGSFDKLIEKGYIEKV